MRDHDLDQSLAGTEVSDEQRAALHAASDATETLYPILDDDGHDDNASGREQAFSGAAMVILGDSTPEALAAEHATAKSRERDAMDRLKGAIIAASGQGVSEVEIARRVGLNRLTVRAALGK